MDRKLVLIILFIALILTGCTAPPSGYVPDEVEESVAVPDRIVNLADLELTTVPDENYYILMDEVLDNQQKVLSRRYAKYDGFQDTVSETVQDINLPRSFQSALNAKEWLKQTAPSDLALFPNTYVSQNVLTQWEQDGYDFSLEKVSLVSLEKLKQMGAVTRINDILEIRHDDGVLAGMIEAIEEEFLPRHDNLLVERSLDSMSSSFHYQISMHLHAEPTAKPSAVLTEMIINLNYSVDELGNPLELTLDASLENKDPRIHYRLRPVVSDLAVFARTMRDMLVSELGLHGVNPDNPALRYANVTLNYDGEEEPTRYHERFYVN
ncbi:MAG: hypothetical protein SCK29_06095 [Bacillota bacterium]|nr:hypothetical protein [Bacillota bacterium]MDW7683678.1 hypothetical protein [Bacillota bacterium]